MKTQGILLLCILSISFWGCAGSWSSRVSLPPEESSVSYTILYNLDKDKAFARVYEWIASTYKNASKVLQMKDDENGVFVIKAVMSYVPSAALNSKVVYLSYTLKIRVEKNKGRLIFETGTMESITMPYDNGLYPPIDDIGYVLDYYQDLRNDIKTVLQSKSSIMDGIN